MPRLAILLMLLAVTPSCRDRRASSSTVDTAIVFAQQAAPVAGPIPGSPLILEDFAVAGLRRGMDSVGVRGVLGPPDSVTAEDDTRDPGAELITWHYRDLILELGTYNSLGGVEITGQGVATRRGLRLGDTIERVRELYGPSCDQEAAECQYEYPGDVDGLTVMQVKLVQGRVTSIYLGHLYD
jgi:hypothetical protein